MTEINQNITEVENSEGLRFRNTAPPGNKDKADKADNSVAEWFEATKQSLCKIVSDVGLLHAASSATNSSSDQRSRRFEASDDIDEVGHRIEAFRVSLTKCYDDQMNLVKNAAQTLNLAREVIASKPSEANHSIDELQTLLNVFKTSSPACDFILSSRQNDQTDKAMKTKTNDTVRGDEKTFNELFLDFKTEFLARLDFISYELNLQFDQFEKRQETRFAKVESMLTMIQGPASNLQSRSQQNSQRNDRQKNQNKLLDVRSAVKRAVDIRPGGGFGDQEGPKSVRMEDNTLMSVDYNTAWEKKESGPLGINAQKLIQEVRAQLTTEFPYNLVKQMGRRYPYDYKCPIMFRMIVLRQQDDGTVKYKDIEAMYVHDLSHTVIGSDLVYDRRPQLPREPTLEYSYQFLWMDKPAAVQLRGKFKFQCANENFSSPILDLEVWVAKHSRNSILLGQDFAPYIRLLDHETSTVSLAIPDFPHIINKPFEYYIKGRREVRRHHGFLNDEKEDEFIRYFVEEREPEKKKQQLLHQQKQKQQRLQNQIQQQSQHQRQQQPNQKLGGKNRKRPRKDIMHMNTTPIQGQVQRVWDTPPPRPEQMQNINSVGLGRQRPLMSLSNVMMPPPPLMQATFLR